MLDPYSTAHAKVDAAAGPMAELKGRELEMVRDINFVDSNLVFHSFPMRPSLKSVKAGCI